MRRSRRGAQAIEFALTLPAGLLLLFGVMDYGWLAAENHALTAAVADGASAGARTAQDDDPIGAAELAATEKWDALGIGAAVTFEVELVTVDGVQMIAVSGELSDPSLTGYVPMPEVVDVVRRRRMEEQP